MTFQRDVRIPFSISGAELWYLVAKCGLGLAMAVSGVLLRRGDQHSYAATFLIVVGWFVLVGAMFASRVSVFDLVFQKAFGTGRGVGYWSFYWIVLGAWVYAFWLIIAYLIPPAYWPLGLGKP